MEFNVFQPTTQSQARKKRENQIYGGREKQRDRQRQTETETEMETETESIVCILHISVIDALVALASKTDR